MKKITLALLAIIGLNGSINSQVTSTLSIPPSNSTSQLRAPNSTSQQAGLKGCYLLKPSECQPFFLLTNSVVTAAGFDLYSGNGGTNVSGQFTLYLQNTTDATYNKGTNFATALGGMTPYYVGNLTLPGSPTSPYLMVTLTPTFGYTGNGIYVAIAWSSVGPFATNPITYNSNYISGGQLGATDYSSVAPTSGTAMVTSDFRPAFTFAAANTASNDIAVISTQPYGQVSKLDANSQVVTAVVRNNSNVAKNSVSVALGVTGANTAGNVATIPTIGAGSVVTVAFNPFTATNNGADNMTVSVVLPDQNSTNDAVLWTQSVTCNYIGRTPSLPATSYTNPATSYAPAAAAGAIFAFSYTTGTAPSSVVSVGCVIPSGTLASNAGNSLYSVLLDATGNILASGNPVVLSSSNMDVFAAFPFTTPQALTPNTLYYFGLATITNSCYPFGTTASPGVILGHYIIPIGGGTPSQNSLGYFSIRAALTTSNLIITAAASPTRICNTNAKSTGTTMITANGVSGMTYSYTASAGTPPSGTSNTIIVSPALTNTAVNASGAFSYTVSGTDPVSGCKSNNAVITLSLQNCSGIVDNGNFGKNISLFPNPAVNGKTNITGLEGSNTITVFNIVGQVVLSTKTDTQNTEIDLQNQAAGNYLIRITNDDGRYHNINVAR